MRAVGLGVRGRAEWYEKIGFGFVWGRVEVVHGNWPGRTMKKRLVSLG